MANWGKAKNRLNAELGVHLSMYTVVVFQLYLINFINIQNLIFDNAAASM